MQFIKQYWTLNHCQVETNILNAAFNKIQLTIAPFTYRITFLQVSRNGHRF